MSEAGFEPAVFPEEDLVLKKTQPFNRTQSLRHKEKKKLLKNQKWLFIPSSLHKRACFFREANFNRKYQFFFFELLTSIAPAIAKQAAHSNSI